MKLAGKLLTTGLKAASTVFAVKKIADAAQIAHELLPEGTKREIQEQVSKVTTKVQESAAALIARHAPDLSRKIADRTDPDTAEQNETLKSVREQLAVLTAAVQKSETAPKKRAPRKPAKA